MSAAPSTQARHSANRVQIGCVVRDHVLPNTVVKHVTLRDPVIFPFHLDSIILLALLRVVNFFFPSPLVVLLLGGAV